MADSAAMTEQEFGALRDDAANYLDITWDDEAATKKLEGILRRGMAWINDKAGADLDYTDEDTPRALLFDYARYARAAALDEFEGNYKSDLVALNTKYRVKEWAANAEAEAAGYQL